MRARSSARVREPERRHAAPDGGLLVTEIGGWIDRLGPDGRLEWSIRSPVAYPSDAQLLPNGRVLVAAFTDPGKIVEVTRSGRVDVVVREPERA